MTSTARSEANRRNSQRSTGPRTKVGKEASSGNALRHGLRAQQVLVFDETPDDFTGFHEALHASLAPADAIEEHFAEQVILSAWRLRRASRAEAAFLNGKAKNRQQWEGPNPTYPLVVCDQASAEMVSLARYESSIERSFHRAYASLERRQARRAGERVLAPITVQIEGDGGVDLRDIAPSPLRMDAMIENDQTKPIADPPTTDE